MKTRDWIIVIIASMEQLIGAALSTVVGIMLPMMQLVMHPELSSGLQGFIGACGLIGIGIGSAVIGPLSDRQGYLGWFRACPIIIIVGSLMCYWGESVGWLSAGLLIIGIGTGGGYSLDSAYISELMPPKWRQTMVGVAKAFCSVGFIGAAVIAWLMIHFDPQADHWHRLILIIGAFGLITLLMRIRWWESPQWLADHGRTQAAAIAAKRWGIAEVPADDTPKAPTQASDTAKSSGKGLTAARIIFSGIPWACEGLGVYGFGVFLPVLVMALGIEPEGIKGIARVLNSVEVTAVVNFFILPGFIIGLLIMRKVSHVKMLTWGFIGSAAGLLLLLASVMLKLPSWVMIIGFVIFEVALNAGPHLITYIIPTAIYPVDVRGTGSGIAALLGKVGAIVGVLLMPMLLDWGGMRLVLIVSTAVMLAGALIAVIFAKPAMRN